LKFMKLVKAFGDRKITALVCIILSSDVPKEFKWESTSLFAGGGKFHQITHYVFTNFNDFIGEKLRQPSAIGPIEKKEVNLQERKEIVRIMLEILYQVDSSDFTIKFPFPKREVSTQSYIRIIRNFIEELVVDSLIGADSVFFKLTQLSERHSGKIPKEGPIMEEIFSLVILACHYSRQIVYHENHNVNVEDLNPIFLAQLVMTAKDNIIMEKIFTFFCNPRIVWDTIVYLKDLCPNLMFPSEFIRESQREEFGCISNVIETRGCWEGKTRWLLEVYRKLFRFQCSKRLENPSDRNSLSNNCKE
jgi:hypothetical protein